MKRKLNMISCIMEKFKGHKLIALKQEQQDEHVTTLTAKSSVKISRKSYWQVTMDSDLLSIAIDSHVSACLFPHSQYFEGKIKMINQRITNIVSGLTAVRKATIKWKWQDEGQTTIFRIPKSLYLPKSPACILSPQYWAQGLDNNYTKNATRGAPPMMMNVPCHGPKIQSMLQLGTTPD